MAKRCPEEFNPWPPFVDIFASTILVLMLFLLITVVNIGYYAQYKFKKAFSGSTESTEVINNDVASKVLVNFREKQEVKVTFENNNSIQEVNFHKVIAPPLDCQNSNNSLFSGGKNVGNAISYAPEKVVPLYEKQKVVTKPKSLIVNFDNKEIFVTNQNKQQIRQFIKSVLRTQKKSHFHITISDPKTLISATIAKQTSLARVLNIRGLIKKQKVAKKYIHMNLQKTYTDNSHPYGSVKIEVRIP